MSETELINSCRKGDTEAFRELYERYASKMMGVCFRYVRERETALDLLHDGFITVFAKISDFRGDGSFEGWLRRIFVTTSLMYLRKSSNFSDTVEVDSLRDFSSSEVSIIDKLSSQELIECIEKLPPGYSAVLNLYAVEGYSHKEIAELLGINEGTSRSQYSRAKAHLHKVLIDSDIIRDER